MTLDYQREIVSTWFDRRADGQNAFDGFIYTWIAFNAALSARYGRLGDKEKVRHFGEELAPAWTQRLGADAELRSAAHHLADQSPIYDEPPQPDGTRKKTVVTAADAVSIMLGIYAVRNNLFHGSKQFEANRDDTLVRTSTRILERIVVTSGLYAMASQPGRDLDEPLASERAP